MAMLLYTRRRGFTLVEMLIVVMVVAILAMLVIPRAMGATRRAKETELRGNLKQLRDAIERFEASTGAWPPQLTDIVAANGAAISGDTDGRGGTVDRKAYDGPYMIQGNAAAIIPDPFTGAADWVYDNTTGRVHSNSTLTAADGTAYSTW
jgi:prepilin-type N-terminal cleavage/methylation domain-containing protein